MIKGMPEKLKNLRTKYGLSQREVADKISVSPSIMSAYETGERTPSVEVLFLLSNVYNCSVDYLLGKQASEPPMTLDTDGLTDKQIQALNALIESMKNQ